MPPWWSGPRCWEKRPAAQPPEPRLGSRPRGSRARGVRFALPNLRVRSDVPPVTGSKGLGSEATKGSRLSSHPRTPWEDPAVAGCRTSRPVSWLPVLPTPEPSHTVDGDAPSRRAVDLPGSSPVTVAGAAPDSHRLPTAVIRTARHDVKLSNRAIAEASRPELACQYSRGYWTPSPDAGGGGGAVVTIAGPDGRKPLGLPPPNAPPP